MSIAGRGTLSRRRILTAGIVAGAVWAALLVPVMVGARSDLDASHTDLAIAREHETAAVEQRSEQVAALSLLNGELELLGRTLTILESETGDATAERDQAQAELDELIPRVELASQQLGQTTQLAEQQVLASINIHRCTSGTIDAVTTLSRGSRRVAIDQLRTIAEPCRNAQLALADGDGVSGFPWDFPDPSVFVANGRYYAFATNSVGGHVQAITSTNLANWSWVGEALPALPAWALPGKTWAPSAMRIGDRYALFFSAPVRGLGVKCIGVAFSDRPGGPYGGSPAEPIVCQPEELGSIDPSPFVGPDGKPYLTWKSDGDSFKDGPAKLWSAPLVEDGTRLEWFPSELLASDRANEDFTIEGPDMVQVGPQWLLLYSSNRWDTANYRMDYALCDGPSGPCRKPPANTFLANAGNVKGPGGGEVFIAGDGTLRLAYHAWLDPDVGFPNSRYLHIDPLSIAPGNRPVLAR